MYIAVIGAGFGDEGKGQTVCDIVNQGKNDSVVIRYNGTAQAAHTVYTNYLGESISHVFSHYGSNSFREYGKTMLDKHFYVHPIAFNKEFDEIRNKSTSRQARKVICHTACPLVTIYDIILNQQIERLRGDSKHGSCGTGFGEAVYRTETSGLMITMRECLGAHMRDNNLEAALFNIKNEYMPQRMKELGIEKFDDDLDKIYKNFGAVYRFIEEVGLMTKRITTTSSLSCELNSGYLNIFEGAQGLLLDRDNTEMMPHLTPSNTGLLNISSIMTLMHPMGKGNKLTVIYVSRCYTTRHGAGPLPHELDEAPYSVVDETNVPNDWQGGMRYSYLNFDLLRQAIEKDKKYAPERGETIFTGLLTCCDQLEGHEIKYIEDDKIHVADSVDVLVQKYSEIIGGPVGTRYQYNNVSDEYLLDEWKYTESDYW